MNRKSLQKGASVVGLVLLIGAFFVLLYNPFLGWTTVTIAVFLIAFSLYTEDIPHLKP